MRRRQMINTEYFKRFTGFLGYPSVRRLFFPIIKFTTVCTVRTRCLSVDGRQISKQGIYFFSTGTYGFTFCTNNSSFTAISCMFYGERNGAGSRFY
jgi:hypothetical protein